MATSREPLSIPGEREHPLTPLELDDATELLIERTPSTSASIDDDREAIERICAAVDGIPLAIELAAARLRVYTPGQLAARLDEQLAVLTHGGRTRPDRHQTLRATLDWSHDLLDHDEQIVFRRLSVFADGFTLDTAEQVVAEDADVTWVIEAIDRLHSRSLLAEAPAENGRRLRLLEPIRQYAVERLDAADERADLVRRHLAWAVRTARHISYEMFIDTRTAMRDAAAEHRNITLAIERATQIDDGISAAKIVDWMAYAWFTAGRPDALHWCELALAAVPLDAPPRARAGALVSTGIFLEERLAYERAAEVLLAARLLQKEIGNALGEAWTMIWLGRAAFATDVDGVTAAAWFEGALDRYRTAGVQAGIGWCAAFLAGSARLSGEVDTARVLAEEAVRIGRTDHLDLALTEGLRVLALLDADLGDFERADRLLSEMSGILEDSEDAFQLSNAYFTAAEIAVKAGQLHRAASQVLLAADLARDTGSHERALDVVAAAALVLFAAGCCSESSLLVGAFHVASNRKQFEVAEQYREVLIEARAHQLAYQRGQELELEEAMGLAREQIGWLIAAPA